MSTNNTSRQVNLLADFIAIMKLNSHYLGKVET